MSSKVYCVMLYVTTIICFLEIQKGFNRSLELMLTFHLELEELECCTFELANRCFAHRTVVKINFFSILTSFSIKNKKKKKKITIMGKIHQKRVLRCFCCVVQPVNSCSACCSLVKIICFCVKI